MLLKCRCYTRRPILTACYHNKILSRSPGHCKDGGMAHSYRTYYIRTEYGFIGWPSEWKGRFNVTRHTLLLCLAGRSRTNLPSQQPPPTDKNTKKLGQEQHQQRGAKSREGPTYIPTKHTQKDNSKVSTLQYVLRSDQSVRGKKGLLLLRFTRTQRRRMFYSSTSTRTLHSRLSTHLAGRRMR